MTDNNLLPFWGSSSWFVWADFGFKYETIDGKKLSTNQKQFVKYVEQSYHFVIVQLRWQIT